MDPIRSTSVVISFKDIPLWLRESEFYKNLNRDESDSPIEIPAQFYRQTDDAILSVEDLVHVLRVMQFWGFITIPYSVLEFCFTHPFQEWGVAVAEVFGEDRKSVYNTLKDAFKCADEFSLLSAMYTRKSEVVDFWISKNEPNSKFGQKAIEHACRRGNIDLIQKLRNRGYEWDTEACCVAAQYGHLPLLKYLHENGCPWDKRAYLYAQRSGQVAVMHYLVEHGQGYP